MFFFISVLLYLWAAATVYVLLSVFDEQVEIKERLTYSLGWPIVLLLVGKGFFEELYNTWFKKK